jgi:1,4-dihydroxy-2-naphthoate octaprenyltransferase
LNHTPTNPTTAKWWQALNPAIYLVSILPALAVALLATSPISHSALWPATVAVVLLQHAINLLNDVKDWQLGADTHKFDSWVRIHNENTHVTFFHGLLSLVSGAILGLFVLIFHQQLWILGFALPLVILGLLYNAGRQPLSYTAVGEWATALCYGPGVFGGLWFVADQPFGWEAMIGMLAFASFSTSLLFSHQPPQIETDRQAGKNSFAVRHGALCTYRVSTALLLTALCLLSLACWRTQPILTSTVFSLGTLGAAIWITPVSPNPKRILLCTSMVFLISFPTVYL